MEALRNLQMWEGVLLLIGSIPIHLPPIQRHHPGHVGVHEGLNHCENEIGYSHDGRVDAGILVWSWCSGVSDSS
jgi:hypothetical protein